jgi:tRNA modification GTPase
MAELIAAIATASGHGGVGIVRLSGDGAAAAASQVFHPTGGATLETYPDRQLVYGRIFDVRGEEIDWGLAFCARAPHSYTGEETAELHCHGSPMVLSLVLEALFQTGARQALAGEFTKRAFLNGRLDLSQAEAVIDLIDAETPAAARLAAHQLGGALSRRMEQIYGGLVDLLAHFYAVLDYPDEDIDPFREETIREALRQGLEQVEALLGSYSRGRSLTRGVTCVLAGRPNVGKSSLLNALAGYGRAIVTELPGTTRDTIEERVTLGGVLLRMVDTAGLRATEDLVEQLGVARSREALDGAELVLLVLDGSVPLTEEDRDAMTLARQSERTICLLNKSDLPLAVDRGELEAVFPLLYPVSAVTGEGFAALGRQIASLFPTGSTAGEAAYLSNTRQYEAARRAGEALKRAAAGLDGGLPPDLLLTDVEAALAALGELTGRTLREDITQRIFERFCVGK